LISDIGLFAAIKNRMHWLQTRQGVLAENVANSDTPGYRARDLAAFEVPRRSAVPTPGQVVPVRTDPAHLVAAGDDPRWRHEKVPTFEVRPTGNSVVLEEEMMKVAQTHVDYQLATSLYSRSVGMLKTALGRRA
jgi:flagellar basal-body rod protein FlgB